MAYRIPFLLAPLIAAFLAMTAAAEAQRAPVKLPVPKVTLYPGDKITADSITMQAFYNGAERLPVAKTRAAVVGKVARRTLIAGKPIPRIGVRAANVVQQGRQVPIVFSSGGLVITGRAMALQSAVPGASLSLRGESGTTIRGTVQPNGTVRVDGP